MDNQIIKTKKQLFKNLIQCYRGWWFWHKVVHQKFITNSTVVILLPSKNKDYNYYALLYLNQLMECKNYSNAVVLTHDPLVAKAAPFFSENIKVLACKRAHAEYLMQYFCLYQFDNRLIIASLEEPVGRKGNLLIGKRGITAEEIFALGVYQLFPFRRSAPVRYTGMDEELQKFLKQEVRIEGEIK